VKDHLERIGNDFIHRWKSGGRRYVIDQLSGNASEPEIAPDEIAAVTAWMMSHLPTWVDQVELRDDLLDMARSQCQAISANPRPT